MSVLVDFACTGCGGLEEVWVALPAPAVRSCPACGAASRRRFGGALLKGSASSGSTPSAGADSGQAPLCQTNPGVPGLCHMVPSAARSWVARARGDNRSLERELASQESLVAGRGPATQVSPVSHDHSPGSGHGHGHGHSHGHEPKAVPASGGITAETAN